MTYEIIIKKREIKPVTKRGEYTTVGKVPWTEDELDQKIYRGLEEFLKENPSKSVYGYAPDYQSTETTETELLRQTVDELDLPAVIKAINKL